MRGIGLDSFLTSVILGMQLELSAKIVHIYLANSPFLNVRGKLGPISLVYRFIETTILPSIRLRTAQQFIIITGT